jgi:hypothetical protein
MALIIKDRVKETVTSPGTTANITLSGASTGFDSFGSVMANGDITYYTIADQVGSNWEVGLGTYLGSNVLQRTLIFDSSNSGSIVNFSSGTQDVFLTYPASQSVYEDNGNAIVPGSSGAIYLTAQTMTKSTTIPSGYNGMVAGSLQVANGVTFIVPNGSIAVVVA